MRSSCMASPQPRIGVVVYPGSNDDRDALWALAALDAEAVPVWHEERELPDLEAGLLPGVLLQNESLRFVCRDVALTVERDDLPFTSRCSQGQRLMIPVKHGDGRWHAPPAAV